MTTPRRPTASLAVARRNGRVALGLVGLTAAMVGLAYASVPFYAWFCATTGYGGTPMVARAAPTEALGRKVTVRFDTNVHPGLRWRFEAETPQIEARLGETVTVMFRITNVGEATTRGTAAFNVTPTLAAGHFSKLACFCFEEQVLKPGETLEAPVTFWVDRSLDDDKNVRGLSALTLSYTFFALPEPARAGVAVGATPKI